MVQAAERPTSSASADAPAAARPLVMSKLEAAGNDFLVVLVHASAGGGGGDTRRPLQRPFTPAQVQMLCTRRRGVGADGVIVGLCPAADEPSRADLEMVLWNADGSEAEMSGNGIRCLVHAAVRTGLVAAGTVRVATAAGLRTVAYTSGEPGTGTARGRVDMGPVRLGAELESPLPGTRARVADVGNPHLVLVGDVDLGEVDLAAVSVAAAALVGEPVNVEVVRRGRDGADLELRVHERGVGETRACGTGTCAAAAVARAYGMVGADVQVDNPGGRLEVRLGPGAEDGVELGGPVRAVADVVVDTAFLGEGG